MSASPAPVGEVKIYYAANRRVRGFWQSSFPSRFIGELPADHVEFDEAAGPPAYGGYGATRFVVSESGVAYRSDTPGGRRAGNGQAVRTREASASAPARGEVFESRAQSVNAGASAFAAGSRVFHLKFGPGAVVAVDGQKLTVDFDRAGRKLVMDSFVTAEG